MASTKTFEKKALIVCYCFLIFLAAYLLFEVEPLTGKIVTPLLGGTSAVWIVCLLFFQIALLGGYLLTYALSHLTRHTQILIYTLLFTASLLWAELPTAAGWNFIYTSDPTWTLLAELVRHLFVPCVILSSVSGTIQVWHASTGADNPYKLYSLSNLGSFGALLMYPTLIEPVFTAASTIRVWAIFYFALCAGVVVTSSLVWRNIVHSVQEQSATIPQQLEKPTKGQIAIWLFFSTLGSAALLTFTQYITTDISPIPLLWVIPLAIYLLSFVIAFAHPGLKSSWFMYSWIAMLFVETLVPRLGIAANLIMLFMLCMVANLRLVASKPQNRYLPLFYLIIATGGAFGGIVVALLAPMFCSVYIEHFIIIVIFTTHQWFIPTSASKHNFKSNKAFIVSRSVMLLVLVLFLQLIFFVMYRGSVIHEERNFFGSATLLHQNGKLVLENGRINHGEQYLDPKKARIDIYPYGPPAALAFAFLHSTHTAQPLALAVVGLGTGSMAVETHTGDSIDFYEIDPKIIKIAKHWFSYLANSPATVSLHEGDGRLLLKNSGKQFDAICIDAFNGDAIPVHLITIEALQMELAHTKPDGLLFFHLTNTYLNLLPVLGNAAKSMGLESCELMYKTKEGAPITYAVLSRSKETMHDLISFAKEHGAQFSNTYVLDLPTRPDLRVWTDDYSNLFSIFKWHS